MDIVGVRRADYRQRLGHFQAVAFQADYFFRIISKETYCMQTQIG